MRLFAISVGAAICVFLGYPLAAEASEPTDLPEGIFFEAEALEIGRAHV